MTTATITGVYPDRTVWDGGNGPITFIKGAFADGSEWSVGAKEANVAARVAELEALIGKEGDFELEAKKEFGGRAQWKLKSWPGKPQGGGGFKGGGGATSFRNTAEGQRAEQESIHRSVALTQAVALKGSTALDTDTVLIVAQEFYNWLSSAREPSKPAHGEVSGPSPAPSPQPPVANGTAGTGTAGVREGPPQGQVSAFSGEGAAETCPSCGSDNTSNKKPTGEDMGSRWRCLACTKSWRVA